MADLIVVDPERTWTVEARALKSKSKNSPFLGWTMQGQVERTYLEGRLVHSIPPAREGSR
jgi:dihydroorotase